jgi:hypothetical protein
VDLVVRDEFPSASDLNHVSQYGTTQLIYTNFSDLTRSYDDIGNPDKFTGFYQYADDQHASREGAFFHVASSRSFTYALNSPLNQQPQVTWFSRAFDTPSSGLIDITNLANGFTTGSTVDFTNAPIYLGSPDQFREIDISVNTPAASSWSYSLEYVSGVNDINGNIEPVWTPYNGLSLPSLTTGGTTAKITFDPPPGWTPFALTSSLTQGSPRGTTGTPYLYYMRLVASGSGTAPTAKTILGYEYLQQNQNGNVLNYTIPAFDYAADTNGDGYLSNAEWQAMSTTDQTTYQARFVYQTRLVTGVPLDSKDGSGSYGPMRVVTNPANSTFKAWVSDYETWNLGQRPASGLFVDNSTGNFPTITQTNQPPVTFTGVLTAEQLYVTNYTQNYASLLKNLQQAVGLVVPNTGGGNTSSEVAAGTVLAATQTSLKENVLLPLASNWNYFENFANQMAPQNLDAGGVYTVLGADLHASLNSGIPDMATDPQAQLTTLAEYYLVADPSTTFLSINNEEHSDSWTRNWLQAAAYDVGQPVNQWQTVKSAPDPTNSSLTYHIERRDYTNALVLYRPRSNDSSGNTTGKLGDNSADPTNPYTLGQSYYVLEPDGTLERNADGSLYQVNQVILANGQGIILIKAPGVTDSFSRPDSNWADGGMLGAPTWTAENRQDPDTMQVVAGAGARVSGGGTNTFAASVLPNISIQDVALEADVTVAQDANTDLIARYQTSGNPAFYEASLYYNTTPTVVYQEQIWLYSWTGSIWNATLVNNQTYSVTPAIPGTTHHLRFVVSNDDSETVYLQFDVDGQTIIDFTSTNPLPAGAVGIRGSVGDVASPTFINFVVQQPSFSGSPQEVYFSDDFAQAGPLGSQPLWNVQPNTDGATNVGSFNVSTGAAVASGPSGYVGGNALINGLTLGDVVVQADVTAPAGTTGWVLADYTGSLYSTANYYEAGLQNTGTSDQVYLNRIQQTGGTTETFPSVQVPIYVAGTRLLRLEVTGNLLRVYVDGLLVMAMQDTEAAIQPGAVGIRSHDAGVTFDNFQATALGAFSTLLSADQFNEPGTSLSSAWSVRQGYYQLANGQAEGDDGGGGRSVAVAQGTVAANVSVSATVTVTSSSSRDNQAGLIAGYVDLTHYYAGVIEYNHQTGQLEAVIWQYDGANGTNNLMTVVLPSTLIGTPIDLNFQIVGNTLTLTVNGTWTVKATVSAPVGLGQVGILADPGQTLDDFSAEALP